MITDQSKNRLSEQHTVIRLAAIRLFTLDLLAVII